MRTASGGLVDAHGRAGADRTALRVGPLARSARQRIRVQRSLEQWGVAAPVDAGLSAARTLAGVCARIAGAALSVAFAAVAGGCGDGGSTDTPASDDASTRELRTIARTTLPGRPVATDASGGRMWILTSRPARLVSPQVVDGHIALRSWSLSHPGTDVAAVSTDVWVAHPVRGTVASYRDGRRHTEVRIPGATLLAPTGHHLWVLTKGGVLVYVNTQTGRRIGQPVSLPEGMNGFRDIVATASGDAWIGDLAGNLARVSASTYRVSKVKPVRAGGYTSLTLAYGRIWAAAEAHLGSISVDGTGEYEQRDLGRRASYLATMPTGDVAVASENAESVTTLDSAGDESRPWKLGDIGPIGVDADATIWVTQPSTRSVTAGRHVARAEQRDPITIDERAGTVSGVGLGDRPAIVLKRVGPPVAYGDSDPVLPLQAPDGIHLGPEAGSERYAVKAPGAPALRYDHVFYLVCAPEQRCAGRVGQIIVTGPGARTTRGIAIGERLAEARARYALKCEDPDPSTSEFSGLGPYCSGVVGQGTEIFFIGDPIDRIELRGKQ